MKSFREMLDEVTDKQAKKVKMNRNMRRVELRDFHKTMDDLGKKGIFDDEGNWVHPDKRGKKGKRSLWQRLRNK